MNPEIKAQWVQALRSGKYEQGRGALEKDGKYCCLGVLCDLAVKAGVIQRRVYEPGAEVGFGPGGNHDQGWDFGTLPPEVLGWADLDYVSPLVETPEGRHGLVWLNDYAQMNFNQIADAIEASL